MKLFELLTESTNSAGYWLVNTQGSSRIWTPVFSSGAVPKDGIFPFTTTQNAPRSGSVIKNFQAFNVLPNRVRQSLSREERELFVGLEAALKQRSELDIIPLSEFNNLVNMAVRTLVVNTGILKQKPNRVFITAPGSSSNVAGDFARAFQQRLKVSNANTFIGHFDKRDVIEIIDDIEAHAPPEDSELGHVLTRLYRNYNKRGDTSFKIKDLWNAHRKALLAANIDIFKLVKSIEPVSDTIPYLLIVDDNVQSGSTAQMIAKLFVQHTGISPANILSVSMFKYP